MTKYGLKLTLLSHARHFFFFLFSLTKSNRIKLKRIKYPKHKLIYFIKCDFSKKHQKYYNILCFFLSYLWYTRNDIWVESIFMLFEFILEIMSTALHQPKEESDAKRERENKNFSDITSKSRRELSFATSLIVYNNFFNYQVSAIKMRLTFKN